MKKNTVLIVEDEAIIALDTKILLEEKGYHVLPIATNASDAVKTALEHEPDVIIMDIFLKGDKTGIDASYEIRNMYQVPIVYLTGNIHLLDDKTKSRIRTCDVITKPPSESELLHTIERILKE
jgi:CheY-like chemotaxis protein